MALVLLESEWFSSHSPGGYQTSGLRSFQEPQTSGRPEFSVPFTHFCDASSTQADACHGAVLVSCCQFEMMKIMPSIHHVVTLTSGAGEKVVLEQKLERLEGLDQGGCRAICSSVLYIEQILRDSLFSIDAARKCLQMKCRWPVFWIEQSKECCI
ncbi:hypothetical protein Ancab_033377 [Ancistrocladus abbreviatus]